MPTPANPPISIPPQIGPFEKMGETQFYCLARKNQRATDAKIAIEIGAKNRKRVSKNIKRAIEHLVAKGHLEPGSWTEDVCQLYLQTYAPQLFLDYVLDVTGEAMDLLLVNGLDVDLDVFDMNIGVVDTNSAA